MEPEKTVALNIDFDEFTNSLIEQVKKEFEDMPADAPMKRTMDWADVEKSLRLIGEAAAKAGRMNPVAFGTSLRMYAEGIKQVITQAVEERG